MMTNDTSVRLDAAREGQIAEKDLRLIPPGDFGFVCFRGGDFLVLSFALMANPSVAVGSSRCGRSLSIELFF